jgi:hypothetical protein
MKILSIFNRLINTVVDDLVNKARLKIPHERRGFPIYDRDAPRNPNVTFANSDFGSVDRERERPTIFLMR